MKRSAFPLVQPWRHVFHGLLILWVMVAPLHATAANNGDYATQFARAQRLVKQGDDAAASRIYEALIKQDPMQPQAYNNLAAIKARHGQLKQAQALLEQALRSNPVYATVYENLSAIYVEMARDSYGKALHLETPQKNIALRELNQPKIPASPPVQVATADKSRPVVPKTVMTPDKTAAETAAKTKPATSVSNVPAQSQAGETVADQGNAQPQADASAPVNDATTVVPTPKATKAGTDTRSAAPAADKNPETAATVTSPPTKVAAAIQAEPTAPSPQTAATQPAADAEQASAAKTPTDKQPQASETPQLAATTAPPLLGPPMQTTDATPVDDQAAEATTPITFNKEEAITTLQGWAAAWTGKAVDLYLSFYADDYAPSGMTHGQWEALRRQRLLAPKWIQVTLRDFQVGPVQDDVVRVRLIQQYKADNYHDLTRKEFRLRHTPDGWRIVEEKTLAKLH